MIDEILKLCNQYNIRINKKLYSLDLFDLIKEIENLIIHRTIILSDPRLFVAQLKQIKYKYKRKQLSENSDFKNRIKKILENSDFTEDDNFLICTKKIDCLIYQDITYIKLLNKNQQKQCRDLGYGITKYWIRKDEKIREVYCEGKHPNLNPDTKQFCLDKLFLDLELNITNVRLLENLLETLNVNDCYMEEEEKKSLIEGVIKDEY